MLATSLLQDAAPVNAMSITGYLTMVTAIGAITMALIQTVKDMTPARRFFQRAAFRRWLAEGAHDAGRASPRGELGGTGAAPAPPDPSLAERRIISLATDGDDRALYDLPIEQMCGQVNAALQVVLDYPARDADVVRIVASESSPGDLAQLLAGPGDGTPAQAAQRSAFVDARTRITHQFQRAVDGFQIRTSFRWKWWLQLLSLALSGALTAFAMALSLPTGRHTLGTAGAIGLGALLSGFLAPVARDLTAAIQRLRR